MSMINPPNPIYGSIEGVLETILTQYPEGEREALAKKHAFLAEDVIRASRQYAKGTPELKLIKLFGTNEPILIPIDE